ncbi:hypothetical protein [Atopobacter phocae]|uniref:hypothetical protein n=1 Tax=Atopobacter phocae TaxID=136492 RepID=UPI0004723C74|nr:hypothetical protein [Atopobacter phocae]
MIKKIMLLFTMLAIGLSVSVKADDSNDFARAGQKYPPVEVTNMKIGQDKFTVKIYDNGYVIPYVNNVEQNFNFEKDKEKNKKKPSFRADGKGYYTVQLHRPLEESDTIRLKIAADGNVYLGTAVYRSKAAVEKEEAERREEREKDRNESLYERYVKYDNSKSWKTKVSDPFRNTWGNFTSWVQNLFK